MTRDELIAALQRHRDNDVRVCVPMEVGGTLILDVTGVSYDSGDFERGDFIAIDTEITVAEVTGRG